MNKQKTKSLIQRAIKKCIALDAEWQHETNPQIVAMRQENKGRLNAYLATLDALNGDTVLLRIDAS